MSEQRQKRQGRTRWAVLNAGIFLAGVLCITISTVRITDATQTRFKRSAEGEVTLNVFDYRQRLYDFSKRSFGTSYQIDEELRQYTGDVHFTGRELSILEDLEYSGVFLDLGRDVQPDSEYSLFHGLRIYKKNFQARQFPFQDSYLPFKGIDRNVYFGRPTDTDRSVEIGLGHTYLLRLAHRTRVGEERMFLLRVLDYTPGVKVTFMWRRLENLEQAP